MFKIIRNAFIAGILIGLGCIANLSTIVPVLGSFLFSLGLITVVVQERKLYTGLIGYLKSWTDIQALAIILVVNLIGIASICYCFQGSIDSSILCQAKYSEGMTSALTKSIGCGMLMYIAVAGYKKTTNLLSIILPVMMFIICGFDHCIANYGYMVLNGDYYCHQLPIWIIGNSIGSLIISKI